MLRCFLFFLFFLLASCDSLTDASKVDTVLQRDARLSYRYFNPFFKKAHLRFPPREIALLVFKQKRVVELYAQGKRGWKHVVNFPILAASGHLGPKLKDGDHQVPEGVYQITALNPESNFELSMKLNYPNQFDQYWAKKAHRVHLGGDIFMHGGHRSIGCIALGNWAISRLYPLVSNVGLDHVIVVISPVDFRRSSSVTLPSTPRWLPILYAGLRAYLAQFPLPNRR